VRRTMGLVTEHWGLSQRLKMVVGREPPPSAYARTAIAEDFAESWAFYFTDTTRLRNAYPLRYEFCDKLYKLLGGA